jgi:2-oxoglutarate dehydrogenase E2 component (dihydrolipoamide succinyltransferase)
MPQLGETVAEGTLTRWARRVGDTIEEDEILFEVSTDKVDAEVPSPVTGVIAEILVPEGTTVAVGTRLAVISISVADGPSRKPAAGASPAGLETLRRLESQGSSGGPPTMSDRRSRAAGKAGIGSVHGGGPMLSPVVRKLIAEHDVDQTAIRGSGAGGRITRSDVLAVIDGRNGGSPASPIRSRGGAEATPLSVPGPVTVTGGNDDEIVAFTNIRRRTAEHMVRSKHTSAHTSVAVEVDYFGVDKVRQQIKNEFRETEGFSLTFLPFIIRAVVDALKDFPYVNSSIGDDCLIVHHDVNIGVAVDLDFAGLVVPVIHRADEKRLKALARETFNLATKARSKKLTMDDISAGTFTITNAGPFGTFLGIPIINQPQVAIVSTDGVKKRPVVVELPDGTDCIAIHPIGNLVMSWDHRAFDGAYAAAFLRATKTIVETRDWSSEI